MIETLDILTRNTQTPGYPLDVQYHQLSWKGSENQLVMLLIMSLLVSDFFLTRGKKNLEKTMLCKVLLGAFTASCLNTV